MEVQQRLKLSSWLAETMPNLFGATAVARYLTGRNIAQVAQASRYLQTANAIALRAGLCTGAECLCYDPVAWWIERTELLQDYRGRIIECSGI